MEEKNIVKGYKAFNDEFAPTGYKAWIIPADDIRDKEAYQADAKMGLLKDRKELKPEYTDEMSRIFKEMSAFLG